MQGIEVAFLIAPMKSGIKQSVSIGVPLSRKVSFHQLAWPGH